MLIRNEESISKLKYFIENVNKVAFGQGPELWLKNNGYSEFVDLVSPLVGDKTKENREAKTLQTKLSMMTFAYGPGVCCVCSKEHNKLNSWKWHQVCSKKCQYIKHSIEQRGSNNTCHRMTAATKAAANIKNSITTKASILSGKFTPKSDNYRVFGMINFELGAEVRSVRSSWEVVYSFLYPDHEYESVRIKYFDTELKKSRIYITDFYDKESNTIIEIKPTKYQTKNFNDKKSGAILAGYNFKVLDENYFKSLQLAESVIMSIKDSIIDKNKHQSKFSWLK